MNIVRITNLHKLLGLGLLLATLMLPIMPTHVHAQDTSVDDEIRQQLDADAEVQEELQQAETLARGETEETSGCSRFLGTCWYFSVPAIIIAVTLLAFTYVNQRNKTDV